MHCPACGVEVVESAAFCHKCGKRLDFQEEPFPPYDGETTASPPAEEPEETPRETAEPSPAEMFGETIAGRGGGTDKPEEQLWRGGYCSKAMLGTWLLTGAISIVLLVLGGFLAVKHSVYFLLGIIALIVVLWLYQFVKLCYRRLNIRYTLTTQRFMHESGILRRVTDRIELIDIDDITVSQRLLERMVGVGTITITSSDATHPRLLMLGIDNAKEIGGLLDETRRAERRRRGLHIESI